MSAKVGRLQIIAVLAATFAGSYYTNVVLVPVHAMTSYFHVNVGAGTLVISGFAVGMAAFTPLASRISEWVGWTKALILAVTALGLGAVGVALSASLIEVVIIRVLQGIVAAVILPSVMMLLITTFSGTRRVIALGAWSSVNSLARIVSVPVSGVLTTIAGWRFVFWSGAFVCGVAVLALVVAAPRSSGRRTMTDWWGGALLTVGAVLCISGFAAIGAVSWGILAGMGMVGIGVVFLWRFWQRTRNAVHPFVHLESIRSPTFVRSCIGSFVQMICLMVDIAGVSLYLAHRGGVDSAKVGLIVLATPFTMTLASPLSGWAIGRFGGWKMFWIGLMVLGIGEVAITLVTGLRESVIAALVGVLALAGSGMAIVQTASASGATRSEKQTEGMAVGVFNLVRFAGSAVGAAWIALVLSFGGSYQLIFFTCAAMVFGGLFIATRLPTSITHRGYQVP